MESEESAIRMYVPTYLTRGPTLGRCSWAKLIAFGKSSKYWVNARAAKGWGEKVEEPLA